MSSYGSVDSILGIINTAANIGHARGGKAIARQLGSEQKKIREVNRDYSRSQFDQAGRDINREAYSQQQDLQSNLNDRGALHSSMAIGSGGKIEEARANRMSALQNKQENFEQNATSEDSIRQLQRALGRNAKNINQINALMQGGLNGLFNYYGAPQSQQPI